MSIRVVCPNGHALKIKDKYAGKAGLCPICKARIKVPIPKVDVLPEESIMDILQPHESGLSGLALEVPDFDNTDQYDSWSRDEGNVSVKVCAKCHKEIPAEAHICPHCQTYVAKLADL
jgi:hypothetical protein